MAAKISSHLRRFLQGELHSAFTEDLEMRLARNGILLMRDLAFGWDKDELEASADLRPLAVTHDRAVIHAEQNVQRGNVMGSSPSPDRGMCV